MEPALNRRFVSISLRMKDVDCLIECLEREKQITNDKLDKAQISKWQLEHDKKSILLRIEDCIQKKSF